MSNNLLIVLVVIAIVIVGGGVWYTRNKKEKFVNYQVNRQEVLEKIRRNEGMCDLYSTGMMPHDNEYNRRELRNNCNCGK